MQHKLPHLREKARLTQRWKGSVIVATGDQSSVRHTMSDLSSPWRTRGKGFTLLCGLNCADVRSCIGSRKRKTKYSFT